MNTSDQAYPIWCNQCNALTCGLTKREHVAAQILAAIVSGVMAYGGDEYRAATPEQLVEDRKQYAAAAAAIADALADELACTPHSKVGD